MIAGIGRHPAPAAAAARQWWHHRRRAGPAVAVVVAAAPAGPAPRRPPPNPGPPKPRRGRRDPPAPLLDFDDDDDDEDEDDDYEDAPDAATQRRRQRLEAAYRRVVSDPSYSRDGDVRLYFKKRRLLAERAAVEQEEGDQATARFRDRRQGGRRQGRRSWVDDNDALPKPDTAIKLSREALAQVLEERSEALSEALMGGPGGGWDNDEEKDNNNAPPSSSSLATRASRLLTQHPGLLSRPTSALASAVRGHARSARLSHAQVLELAAGAPRLLLAHPDAAEARAGLLQRALGAAAGGGSGGGPHNKNLASALLWRYPSALGTARVRPVVEWAEALAAAVASVAGEGGGGGARRRRGPPAGAPAAGAAEALAVLAAGVKLLPQPASGGDEESALPEGYARDAWLRRAGPEVAAAAVASLAARLGSPAALPLFPMLRAEPALLLEPGHPLRVDAWRRLEVSLGTLEALFVDEQQQGAAAAATAAASRALLLAPKLVRVIGGLQDDAHALLALKDALRGMAQAEWLFVDNGNYDGDDGGGGATSTATAISLARQHPRLLLVAAEGVVAGNSIAGASSASAARDALTHRADTLARRLAALMGEEDEAPPSHAVRRTARADPSLLAAPPSLVARALVGLARGLTPVGEEGAADGERAATARLWRLLFPSSSGQEATAAPGAWAAAERGWLPLQLRALCTCLRMPAASVRRLLLLPSPSSPEEQPPALAALAASPAELRQGQASLNAAYQRLAERRRRYRRRQQQQQQQGPESLPSAAAAERLRAALPPALAAAALAPNLNAAAVAALDACSPEALDAEVVDAVRVAVTERWSGIAR